MTRSSTAQQRLRQLLSPGKRPMTRTRRCTSPRERSSRFVERSRRRRWKRVAQVDAEGGQVLRQAGGGAWVLALQLADQAPQTCFRLLRRGGAVERGPVGGLDPSADASSFRQLGQDVAQAVDAALAVGLWPELLDSPYQPRRAVGHRPPG